MPCGRNCVLRILFVCLYVLLSVSGIVLIKSGAATTAFLFEGSVFQLKASLQTVAGFCCYIISFLMMIRMVALYELSYIVPITTGMVQILILLAAVFLFRERIAPVNLVGIFVVISGIVLMNLKVKGPTP